MVTLQLPLPHHYPARDPPFAAALALAAFRPARRPGWNRRRPHHVLTSKDGSLAFAFGRPRTRRLRERRRAHGSSWYVRRGMSLHATSDLSDGVGLERGGTYVDLGSISFDGPLDGLDPQAPGDPPTTRSDAQQSPPQLDDVDEKTIEEWRARHWVVLVDDESGIRLAIGDYLHSVGYCNVTACDGPMAFLELLLHSCSWSLTDNEASGGGEGGPPPWMDDVGDAKWRLPNCVISDIRMPGGIDGVQLLGLLRRIPDKTDEVEGEALAPKKKKRGRPKKKASASSEYDERDEYDLLDAIVSGDSSSKKERITTPEDQAMKYLDAIRECIDYLGQSPPVEGQVADTKWRYPAAPEQMPVVLLTAKAMVADRIAGYRAGANGYLPKPFRPEELLGMVDGLMRKQERERSAWASALQNDGGAGGNGDTGGKIDGAIADLTPEQVVDITRDLIEIRKLLQAHLERQKSEKEILERERLRSLLPKALWMLRTGERRPRAFNKDHIRSILFFCYGVWFPKNNTTRKGVMEELKQRVAEEPEKLESLSP